MGQTLKELSKRELTEPQVFDKRFVIELCEKFHIHYRGLRILLSETDFVSIADGFIKAFKRWEGVGKMSPGEGTHIELCRKRVADDPQGVPGIAINLNRNLYLANEDRVFSEGANFFEPVYVHLKIRDLRHELSLDEFNALHDAVVEAKATLKSETVNA